MAEQLRLDGISAGYGGHNCLHNINLRCGGGLLSVVGVNGCGKSTLLRVAAGLMAPSYGEVSCGGSPLRSMSEKERARHIAYLPQSMAPPDVTAGYFVLMSRFAYTDGFGAYSREDRAAAANVLERMKITELSGRSMSLLSGGERQKVYLAAALAKESGILLFDEPQTYLDPDCAQFLWNVLRELGSEGRCVICVTHDLVSALRYSDRIAVMKDGRLLGEGDADAVCGSGLIREALGVELVSVGGYYAIK